MVASGDIRPEVVKSIAAMCVPVLVKGSQVDKFDGLMIVPGTVAAWQDRPICDVSKSSIITTS